MKKFISLLVSFFLLTSCSVEKVNLSPLSNSFSNYSTTSHFSENTYKSFQSVDYISEITNTLSEFPIFKNQRINAEVYKMKLYISDYIYAIRQKNSLEENIAYKNYSQTYKNIQNLKTSLSTEELELLNRYLAKIKTNITLIDSIDITKEK